MGSNRSSRISFTRPLSGFVSKSVEILFVDQRLSRKSVDELGRCDTSSGSTPNSPLNVGEFGERKRPEISDTRSNGRKSWSKFSSPSFFNRRGTKTPINSESPPCTPQEDLLFPDQGNPPQHDETTVDQPRPPIGPSPGPPRKVVRQRSCSCPTPVVRASEAAGSGPSTVCKTNRTSISPFVVTTILQMLLLCICPPRDLIAAGGTGMLLVYTALMVGLACLSWVIFDGDGDQGLVVKIMKARSRVD